MKWKQLSDKKRIETLLLMMTAVVVILAYFKAPSWLINSTIEYFMSAIVGTITSLVAALIVKDFTGDTLKKIFLVAEIKGVHFSISLFAVATIVVKYALFHSI